MTVSNEPEILKEVLALMTKGIAGQLGKSKAVGMVVRDRLMALPGFSISERTLFLLMTRVKWNLEWMNQRDICDRSRISMRRKSVLR
jgi:molybdopterin biosynthesis enzyme